MDTDSAQFPTQPRVVRARGSVYGIRPHYEWSEEDQTALLNTLTNRTLTMYLGVNQTNRPAVELMFDVCLECRAFGRANCICYERGYN